MDQRPIRIRIPAARAITAKMRPMPGRLMVRNANRPVRMSQIASNSSPRFLLKNIPLHQSLLRSSDGRPHARGDA